MKPAINTSLLKEIQYVQAIKNGTDQNLQIANPGHHLTETNLVLLGERIFQFLTDNQSISELKELKMISDLIQKHTTAYNKIKRLEIRLRELAMKEQLFQLKLQKQGILPKSTDEKSGCGGGKEMDLSLSSKTNVNPPHFSDKPTPLSNTTLENITTSQIIPMNETEKNNDISRTISSNTEIEQKNRPFRCRL